MTIREFIYKCDMLRPKAIDDMEKVEWLEELDRNLYTEFFSKFTTKQDFTEYGDDTGATLLVNDAFASVYVYYVLAQIDFHLAEIARYNNDMLMFNQTLDAFERHYTRTHSGKDTELKNIMS